MNRFVFVVFCSVAATVAAQQPTPTFEVASVKPNMSGSCTVASNSCQSFIRLQPGGNFLVGNRTLRELIQFAYRLQSFQLVGGPDWIANERFDITAKASGDFPPPTPPAASTPMLMLRALLAERFRLRVRFDTREMPVYALVLARNDGQLGAQIRRSEVDCNALAKGLVPQPPKSERPLCGLNIRGGTMMMGALPISSITEFLSVQVERHVVDQTGLTGAWDLDLRFNPDLSLSDSRSPTIFTALQEQLGLKLESTRGSVEVLVIDAVERPTPD
jgi:uncharacterized protein (TIGR03435 family)